MNNYVKTLTFKNNERVFYTTDIHGCYHLLKKHLDRVGFNDDDILIVGGDTIDRGMSSESVLEYLDKPNIHVIKANHEDMFIKSFDEGWCGRQTDRFISNGGYWVDGMLEYEIKAIYDFFTSLPTAIKLELNKETIGIVHAECSDDWDVFTVDIESNCEDAYVRAIWGRSRYANRDETIVRGVDRVLVGHTPTNSGGVETLGNVQYCDTGAFFTGILAFIQLQ